MATVSVYVREDGAEERCCDAACVKARAEIAEWDRTHRDSETCAACDSPLPTAYAAR